MDNLPVLSLSRRDGEALNFYDDRGRLIGRVEIVHTTKGRVRLYALAPRDVRIMRDELVAAPSVVPLERSLPHGLAS